MPVALLVDIQDVDLGQIQIPLEVGEQDVGGASAADTEHARVHLHARGDPEDGDGTPGHAADVSCRTVPAAEENELGIALENLRV